MVSFYFFHDSIIYIYISLKTPFMTFFFKQIDLKFFQHTRVV